MLRLQGVQPQRNAADTLSRYSEASWWEHREQELWAELLKLEESDG